MKLNTQLYIDTNTDPLSDSPTYELIDFFDFESVEITSAIKTIQEVDKVFTDYSRGFVVPASSNNNRIFQHFYNPKVQSGFDARIKRKARIFLNGVFFKQGYVRLESSKIKDGYPSAYDLTFFGALSGLEDIIGADELSSLTYLSKYDHTYSANTVQTGLQSGLEYSSGIVQGYTGVSRDIVYPLISSEDSFFYDSNGTADGQTKFSQGTAQNIYNDTGGSPDNTKGLGYQNLKPAIKVSHIIDAITERYDSINFSSTSFIYKNQIKDLYMLLHNNKSILSTSQGDFDEQTAKFTLFSDDFTYSSGSNFVFLETYSRIEGSNIARRRHDIDLTVTVNSPASDIQFYVELYSNGRLLETWSPQGGGTLSYELESKENMIWSDDLYYIIKSNGGLANFDLSLSITTYYETVNAIKNLYLWAIDYKNPDISWNSNSEVANYTGVSNYTFLTRIEILKHIPKMKVIDFLKGLFQMFNLVADVDKDTGEINIITLNDYYDSGTDRDITDYVDTFNYDVDRVQLYGKMEFRFSEPKTFGLLNHNEQLNDEFGDLSFDPAREDNGSYNLVFDKGNYEVKLPFEKLYYEALTDEADSPQTLTEQQKRTDICWGWLADKDQNSTLTKPILFYNTNESVDSIYKFGVRGVTTPLFLSTYNRAGNSNSDESYSLNFNEERDEFSLNFVENSLFNLYYRGYVTNMFDKLARTMKVEARLPISFLFQYKLNDRLFIDGVPFRINEITTNLNTGKSQLDLITDFGIVIEEIVDTTDPSQVSGVVLNAALDTGLEISWNEASDNVAVTNYNIYVDGVLNKTLGSVTSTRITGLSPSTSYSIEVSAVDGNGNEGLKSSPASSFSTVATPTDTQSPTIPTNLRTTLIGSTAIGIEWDASTDDTAVADYRIYVDGVFDQTITAPATTANVSGLTANTEYSITVSARDAVPNESAKSTPLLAKTLTT